MNTPTTTHFKHVSYLWNEAEAAKLEGDEVGLLIYRSNLLGADLRLTNYGGGNTSCKAMAKDPVTGEETEVMWVKGSGGDIGTLKKSGLAALYVDKLRSLLLEKKTNSIQTYTERDWCRDSGFPLLFYH
jgi:rhamnose utilization protein RhaD (predicted bifunctional aldolase and dehydrogenase)